MVLQKNRKDYTVPASRICREEAKKMQSFGAQVHTTVQTVFAKAISLKQQMSFYLLQLVVHKPLFISGALSGSSHFFCHLNFYQASKNNSF